MTLDYLGDGGKNERKFVPGVNVVWPWQRFIPWEAKRGNSKSGSWTKIPV
jgi:hypothetical protein